LLYKHGIDPLVVEPNIESHKKFKIFTVEETLAHADILVFLVAHDQFRQILQTNSNNVRIMDFCGIHNAFIN